MPTAEIVNSSNDFGGWYRAPSCQREAAAAARPTKTHTSGPTPHDRSLIRAVGMMPA
jgi:hypothetical protein